MYATNQGIAFLTTSESSIITDTAYNFESWQELSPTSMRATVHDDKYWVWHYPSTGTHEDGVLLEACGGLVIDLVTRQITQLDFLPSAVYTDPETDILYRVKYTDYVLLLETGDKMLNEDENYMLTE